MKIHFRSYIYLLLPYGGTISIIYIHVCCLLLGIDNFTFRENSFRFFLSHVKLAKNTVFSSFITDFTTENAPTSGRYLRRHR